MAIFFIDHHHYSLLIRDCQITVLEWVLSVLKYDWLRTSNNIRQCRMLCMIGNAQNGGERGKCVSFSFRRIQFIV